MKKMRYILVGAVMLFSTVAASAQEHPAETYGWGFVNFGTPSFGWDIYRNSFYGIPVDSGTSWFTAPFDKLFYDLAFETTLADPSGAGGGGAGNCFGLSILSLMINNYGGYKGFCAPTIQYTATDGTGAPTDPGLLRAINIMHGHQISLLFIQSVIEQVNGGHALDAAYGVARAQQDIAREGPVIVSVTASLFPTDGGHAVIGYAVENQGAGRYHIKVVDPNRIWADTGANHRGWYTSDSNNVYVDGHDWSFLMAGAAAPWPDSGSAGNLTIYPLSVAGPTSRTPSSLGLGVTALLSQVFIMNRNGALDGRILQIRNRHGKRLFRDSTRYEVDWDTATGMARMVPFYPMAAPPNGVRWPFELYFHKGALNGATVEFATGEGDAEIVAGDNRGYVRLTASDPDLNAELAYGGIGGSELVVRLGNASHTTRVDLEVLVPVQPGVTNRVLRIRNIELVKDEAQAFTLRIDRWGSVEIGGTAREEISIEYRQGSLEPNRNFVAAGMAGVPADGITITSDQWQIRGRSGDGVEVNIDSRPR